MYYILISHTLCSTFLKIRVFNFEMDGLLNISSEVFEKKNKGEISKNRKSAAIIYLRPIKSTNHFHMEGVLHLYLHAGKE